MSDHEEYQYLNMIKELLKLPKSRENRTGINTLSLFNTRLKFTLSNNVIPVLTTKKMNFRTIICELLWMLKGHTDNKILKDQGINIWTGNSTKEFLEKNNLPYEEDDIGPGYGFQWRHWGAKYIDCKTDYTGQGIDQIAYVVDQIKNNPMSRRIIMSAWNVCDLEKMALPPCHCFVQFYVVDDDKLSCCLYQRSGDVGLGVPFNITSYSALLYIIAHLTNKTPFEFYHIIGDYHIYVNHIEGLKKQIELTPYKFPTIKIKPFDKIEDLTYEHFELIDYEHHGLIKLSMAV